MDERVGRADQATQHRLAFGVLKVEGDRTLVAIVVGIKCRDAGSTYRLDDPHAIAIQRLDFDDVGSEVPQDLRCVGAQDNSGDVDDAVALE